MKAQRGARRSSSARPQSAGQSAGLELRLLVDLVCRGPARRAGSPWDLLGTGTGK